MPEKGFIEKQFEACQTFNYYLMSDNGSRLKDYPKYCFPQFDGSICWNITAPSDYTSRECPFEFCSECPLNITERSARRACFDNGSWTRPDYSACVRIVKELPNCVASGCAPCPDMFRDIVKYTSMVLSVLSVVLLLISLILFSSFKNLQCRRLSIHKNLAGAFVCRFFFFAIWTILQDNYVFKDCDRFHAPPIPDLEWLCKTVLWLVIYFQVASVLWMLVEGSYLYSRFTIFAMRHGEGPYAVYLCVGWGVPFFAVGLWTILHEIYSRREKLHCWMPYADGGNLWILAGTMGAALILNLLFLLAIVVILVKKLRADNSAESKKIWYDIKPYYGDIPTNMYHIWKTIKATLLLVPLLGISNIPLFYEPPNRQAAYMLISTVLQHSQGIFIAVLYCFLNGEIQDAVKRQLRTMPFYESFSRRKPTQFSMGMSECTTAFVNNSTPVPVNKNSKVQSNDCRPRPRANTNYNINTEKEIMNDKKMSELNLPSTPPETQPLSQDNTAFNYRSYRSYDAT